MESAAGSVTHPNGQYYFITSLYKRFASSAADVIMDTVCDPSLAPYLKSTGR